MKQQIKTLTDRIFNQHKVKQDDKLKELIQDYYTHHLSVKYDLQNLTDKRNAMQKIYLATPDNERYSMYKFIFLTQYEILSMMVEEHKKYR